MISDRTVLRPTLLTAGHEVDEFRSGEPSIDDWLRVQAACDPSASAPEIHVIALAGARRVIGYYSLSMGRVLSEEVVGFMRRNMSREIPSVVLGRLAIDADWQGQGLGRALLHDAVLRSLQTARDRSARLLVAHALSPEAEAFYRRHGFTRLPVETPTLALDLVKLSAVAMVSSSA